MNLPIIKKIENLKSKLSLNLWIILFSILFSTISSSFAQESLVDTDLETNSVEIIDKQKNKDPIEKFNRKIHRFNHVVDKKVFKPIAKRYLKHVPEKVRRGVRNFVANLREPTTIVNDLLQGKPDQAAQDTLRFVINSTFGLAGIFDVASHLQLPRNREDFGQTFGKWGVPSGPYLVLPFLGPSNLRDLSGLVPQYAYTDLSSSINSGGLVLGTRIAGIVDTRARLLPLDDVLESQLDPYVFIRESYKQTRIRDINDGQVEEEEEDEFLNEILEQGD